MSPPDLLRVKGQRSKVKGQRSRVKGQRSKVKGQGSRVKGQSLLASFSHLPHYSQSPFPNPHTLQSWCPELPITHSPFPIPNPYSDGNVAVESQNSSIPLTI
ncbi:hypothetical protein FDUTEX481_05775 [Tolypothrix sp. PCC 7601]|nr:hypothetical protein FDUTEX481_05775 [Tolypothrix sp. PCC 7601]